jgi:hypothetical protein
MQRRLSGTVSQADIIVRRASWFARAEKAVQQAVRNGPCLRAFLPVVLTVAIVCAYFIPQFMTGTNSFRDAKGACRDNFISRMFEHGDPGTSIEEFVDLKEAEERFEYKAASHLETHIFNTAPTFFSLACFLLWVFATPHHDSSETILDQKRNPFLPPPSCSALVEIHDPPPPSPPAVGCFYAIQLLGNFAVMVSSAVSNCTASQGHYRMTAIAIIIFGYGLSILGTNLLCHRYLLEKAKGMSRQ